MSVQDAGRTCTLERGSGKVTGADVTDVAVHCISNDVALTSLELSAGPLLEPFEPTRTDYRAKVELSPLFPASPASTSTTVTANARMPGAPIAVQNNLTVSGEPSASITLVRRETNIVVVVVTTPTASRRSEPTSL